MTAVSRRNLLKTSALAAAATLVPEVVHAAVRKGVVASRVPLAPSWPLRSTFAAQIGSMFVASARSLKPVRLQLTDVGDLPSAKAAGTMGFEETFAVHFNGPVGVRLRQGTYDLRHAALGSLSLFIVPIGRPGKVQVYEAIFNHQTA
jgi:TAT (twin-arginine translocation) pathway signal sequence